MSSLPRFLRPFHEWVLECTALFFCICRDCYTPCALCRVWCGELHRPLCKVRATWPSWDTLNMSWCVIIFIHWEILFAAMSPRALSLCPRVGSIPSPPCCVGLGNQGFTHKNELGIIFSVLVSGVFCARLERSETWPLGSTWSGQLPEPDVSTAEGLKLWIRCLLGGPRAQL